MWREGGDVRNPFARKTAPYDALAKRYAEARCPADPEARAALEAEMREEMARAHAQHREHKERFGGRT
jgi:hypothetical protein